MQGNGKKTAVVVLLLVLTLGPFSFLAGSKSPSAAAAPTAPPLAGWPQSLDGLFGPTSPNPRVQFGLSFWTINDFSMLTGGCQTEKCYADAIQKYLLPHNIYWVPIYQYGDANTSSSCQGSMCLQSNVDNLLAAGDQFGMHFLFWFPAWGFDGGGEASSCNIPVSQSGNAYQTEVLNYWAAKLGVSQASLAEVDSSGNPVCVLRQDYVSLWSQQMDRDVYEIYQTYGSHPSFAGFLQYWEFSVGFHAYDNTGYSAQTQANFSRSQFYSSGCLQCYLQYEFQQVLNNAAMYCQTLMPSCIIMSDQAPASSPDVANYYGYSLAGGPSPNSWPSTYGADDEGATCSATYNCGIGRGFVSSTYQLDYPNYVAGEAIGFRCYPGTPPAYSCNNGNYNTVQAIPYQLAGSYPNQITPLVWIQTSAASLVSNFTNDAQGTIPANAGATTGQDYLYNERYFAYVASNTAYLGREPGYSSKPLANILLVNSDPADGNSYAASPFLTQEFLQSVGFNVTAASVSQVKDLNLLRFNTILWTSADQPNEANMTTYNDIVNAVNNGVGFILVGNAGSGYAGGTGLTASTLSNLFGLTYPMAGCCWIPNDPAPVSGMTFNDTSSAAKTIFSPYGSSLSMSDFVPNMSPPKEYLYAPTSTFTSSGGIVLASATDSDNGQSFPTMVAVNGTGSGHGRMLWLGTTYDTSGLYGSYVSTGLYTKQLDVYINALLYASNKDSLIPYIWSNSSQPPYYPGITFSMLGANSGSDLVWFSDYTHVAGGTSTESIDYNFRSSAMGISGNWIALNLANMQVVNKGTSTTISLPLTMQNETWAPVYVSDLTPTNLGLVYSNSLLQSQSMGMASASYSLTSPPDSGSWLVLRDSGVPSSVAAGGSALTQYYSLSSLVSATMNAYMQTNANNWTPASGWFYDSANQLLYVAYVGGSNVHVVVDQPSTSSTSSSSSVSSSSSTSSSTSSSSSSSTSSRSSSSSSVTSSSTSITSSMTLISSTSTAQSSSTTKSLITSKSTSAQSFAFELALSQSSGSVLAGQSLQAGVSVILDTGRPEVVGLSAVGLPQGVSVSFSPTAGTPGFVSDVQFSTTSAAHAGTYTVTIIGSSGPVSSSATFQLTIEQGPAAVYQVSVASATGGITNPPSGTYSYAAGQVETVTAMPNPGWFLQAWVVNGVGAGNGSQLTFVTNRNLAITPVFAEAAVPAGPTPSVSVAFLSSSANASSISVDGTQYSLPASFSWPKGSVHTVSAVGDLPTGGSSKLVFAGWQGGANSTSSTISLTAEPGVTLVAEYKASYLASFAFVDPRGAPVSPLNATFLGPAGFVTVSQSNSSAWLEAGSQYSLVGAQVGGTSVPAVLKNLGVVDASHPGRYTVPLSLYPVSIKVVDVFNQPISGSTVTLTTEGGQVYTQVTGASGTATFNDVPLGWYHATYSYMGVSGSLGSQTAGAQAATATLVLSYPLVALVAVFAVGLAIAVMRARRRAPKLPQYEDFYS